MAGTLASAIAISAILDRQSQVSLGAPQQSSSLKSSHMSRLSEAHELCLSEGHSCGHLSVAPLTATNLLVA